MKDNTLNEPVMTNTLFSFPLAEARVAPNEPGRISALIHSHGSMSLRYYVPDDTDPQTPHDQDEVYIVASGSGIFRCGDDECAFSAGDALFAPAGVEHRFVGFTKDFATWVIFYGPKGGEV